MLGGPADEGRASYQVGYRICPSCKEGALSAGGEEVFEQVRDVLQDMGFRAREAKRAVEAVRGQVDADGGVSEVLRGVLFWMPVPCVREGAVPYGCDQGDGSGWGPMRPWDQARPREERPS